MDTREVNETLAELARTRCLGFEPPNRCQSAATCNILLGFGCRYFERIVVRDDATAQALYETLYGQDEAAKYAFIPRRCECGAILPMLATQCKACRDRARPGQRTNKP
jgi:hypothetical protein